MSERESPMDDRNREEGVMDCDKPSPSVWTTGEGYVPNPEYVAWLEQSLSLALEHVASGLQLIEVEDKHDAALFEFYEVERTLVNAVNER